MDVDATLSLRAGHLFKVNQKVNLAIRQSGHNSMVNLVVIYNFNQVQKRLFIFCRLWFSGGLVHEMGDVETVGKHYHGARYYSFF